MRTEMVLPTQDRAGCVLTGRCLSSLILRRIRSKDDNIGSRIISPALLGLYGLPSGAVLRLENPYCNTACPEGPIFFNTRPEANFTVCRELETAPENSEIP